MRYVIIGNGVASIGAIEGIRKHDPDGEIVVLSEEDKVTYGRPLITYYLAKKVTAEQMALRPDSFYARNKVSVRLGAKAEAIDTAGKTVTLASGEAVAFDRLLLATGGRPTKPDIPGLDGPGVFSFTTWADADALRDIIDHTERFVVVGAGLIALKAAEALLYLKKDVTLVVRSRIMRTYFDENASELIVKHLDKKGLKFLHGAKPTAILRNGKNRVEAVQTDAGRLPAEAVIIATGVSPEAGLARAAGLTVNKGVVVNDFMRTSAPDVFAAGDVAEARDLLSGERAVTPIWPSAYNQGLNAGINMAGAKLPYPGGLAMNSLTFLGLGTISIGLTNPPRDTGFEVHLHQDPEHFVYRKMIFKDDKLVGAILIGDLDHAGIYGSFIRHGLPVDAETKAEILSGTPSPLYWPEDFFAEKVEDADAPAR